LDWNQELILQLHEAQREFYAGGSEHPLRGLLAEDIVWTVPGRNAIAGRYEGIDEVMDYFTRRRDIASRTFTMHTARYSRGGATMSPRSPRVVRSSTGRSGTGRPSGCTASETG
jgi:ketosteroid isomerase-like protein